MDISYELIISVPKHVNVNVNMAHQYMSAWHFTSMSIYPFQLLKLL